MINEAEERGKIIKHLEDAVAIAEEIEDGTTGYLIEQALDEARSRLFVPRASSAFSKFESYQAALSSLWVQV
jgi:hypothetical protein